MDITAAAASPDVSFVPKACVLPTAEQPLRVAAFAELFAAAVRDVVRRSPTGLRLTLRGGPATEATARELAARETECCSFFTFTFGDAGSEAPKDGLTLDVTVPAAYVAVLDGMQRLAETAGQGREPA